MPPRKIKPPFRSLKCKTGNGTPPQAVPPFSKNSLTKIYSQRIKSAIGPNKKNPGSRPFSALKQGLLQLNSKVNLCDQLQILSHVQISVFVEKSPSDPKFWLEHAPLYANLKSLSNPFFKGKFGLFSGSPARLSHHPAAYPQTQIFQKFSCQPMFFQCFFLLSSFSCPFQTF